jgi:hypothetical protein
MATGVVYPHLHGVSVAQSPLLRSPALFPRLGPGPESTLVYRDGQSCQADLHRAYQPNTDDRRFATVDFDQCGFGFTRVRPRHPLSRRPNQS